MYFRNYHNIFSKNRQRMKSMFDFAAQNAFPVSRNSRNSRNFVMFSSIFRLGKQAKYSFCRPHNLRSLFNQQILVAPTAVRFQMDFKQAHSLASKKNGVNSKPRLALTHTNYHKEHSIPPFKRIRVLKYQLAGPTAEFRSRTEQTQTQTHAQTQTQTMPSI